MQEMPKLSNNEMIPEMYGNGDVLYTSMVMTTILYSSTQSSNPSHK